MRIVCFFLIFTIFSSQIEGRDNYADFRHYKMNDKEMHKIASQMIVWGIVFTIGTLIISGFLPNSPSPNATTSSTPAPGGGGLL